MTKPPTQKLAEAVEETVQLINSGATSPQAALKKVAVEQNLGPKFIKRASEAINVALHYNHFRENPTQKEASFPITDAAQVVREIYGKTEKTAAQQTSDLITRHSSSSDNVNFSKMAFSPKHQKCYQEIMECDENYDSFPMSIKTACEQSADHIQRLEKEYDHLHTESVGAKIALDRAFSTVVSEFSKDEAARSSFAEFEKQAFATHGERAEKYLDLVYNVTGCTEPRGTHDPHYRFFDKVGTAKLFDAWMDAADSLLDIQGQEKVAEYNLNFERGFVQTLFQEVGAIKVANAGENAILDETPLSDILKEAEDVEEDKKEEQTGEEEESDPVLDRVKNKMAQAEEVIDEVMALDDEEFLKHAEETLGHIKAAAAENSTSKGRKAFSLLGSLQEPFKQAPNVKAPDWRNNVEKRLIFQNLLMADPVIKHHPPHKVADAYAQILRISPDMAGQREVTRAVLRGMLEGQALGPFEAKQLIDTDESGLRRHMSESKVQEEETTNQYAAKRS